MNRILTASVLALTLAAPAMAEDWTGFYAGGQIGYSQGDVIGSAMELDGMGYGVHVGGNYDMGNWVIGGELAYSGANHAFTSPLTEGTELGHLKLRAGYDLGQGMVYGVAGLARTRIEFTFAPESFTETGSVFGLGYEHKVSDRMSIGAEYLRSTFTDVNGTPADLEYDTIQGRISFHF